MKGVMNMEMPKEFIEFFREQYPLRSRIRLREMEIPDDRLKPGALGTLYNIEDDGRFLVKWDTGLWQYVRMGHDAFAILPPATEILKFYMPMAAEVYLKDEHGDYEMDGMPGTQRDILGFEDAIIARLLRLHLRGDLERGLMESYNKDDTVNQKVKSIMFTAEQRNGQLWGVAVCQVADNLDEEELEILKDYIKGQASDGIGESFESYAFQMDEGKMHVMLCEGDDWSIQTEQERFPMKLAEGLPGLCFSVNKTTGALICIKKGEMGYYPSDWSTKDPEENKRLADYSNERLGITKAQRLAMESGSMFGWDNANADPTTYEQATAQNQDSPSLAMGGM